MHYSFEIEQSILRDSGLCAGTRIITAAAHPCHQARLGIYGLITVGQLNYSYFLHNDCANVACLYLLQRMFTVELKPRAEQKIRALIDKGVSIPNPLSLDIGDEVDIDNISASNVVLYPGTRLYGDKTVIAAGAILGREGTVTVDNCQIGPQVREACILEEEASGAHCVGLKHTILFPFVTLGTVLKGRVISAGSDSVRIAVADTVIECVGDVEACRQVVLCIRPENVTLAAVGTHDGDSARNHFAARVTRIIPMGHFLKVQLDSGFFLSTHITRHSREMLGITEGAGVVASFKATAVHIIAQA